MINFILSKLSTFKMQMIAILWTQLHNILIYGILLYTVPVQQTVLKTFYTIFDWKRQTANTHFVYFSLHETADAK